MSKGLTRKSYAPSRMASTAVSISVIPVMTMTGIWSVTAPSFSISPNPSITGMRKSVKIRSKSLTGSIHPLLSTAPHGAKVRTIVGGVHTNPFANMCFKKARHRLHGDISMNSSNRIGRRTFLTAAP